MSATLMGASLYLPLPQSHKLLLVTLSDHAHDDGLSCYPGNELMAKKTSVTVRQVQRNLQALEDAGWIARYRYATGGKGHAVEWQLNVAMMFAAARENGWTQTMTSAPPFASKGRHPRPERVTPVTGKGDMGDTPTIMNHHEPDSLRLQQENPRQPGETAGRYAARIAALIAAATAPTRPANQTSTDTETDATTVGTSPPPSARQPTVRTRSDDQ